MEISAKIRFSNDENNWLCFRHAVILSLQGKSIELDIGDYDSEHYMGDTVCKLCMVEPERKGEIGRLPRHYSGSNSVVFWDIIHKVDKGKTYSKKFQYIYRLACDLQESESNLLKALEEEEL